MGARPLKGAEAEQVLTAANLNALPQVFYAGPQGLNLVIKEGTTFVPNPSTDIAKEVSDYLNREHAYGNKDTRTGKALESHFGGLGYGWERDMLRLVLAVLFRAGAIDVSYGGQRFDSYQTPQARTPFTNNNAFKTALFTPAKPIDLKTLRQAVENFESLTGQTVEMEKNAIATAVKKLADDEMKVLLPTQARAQANSLPVMDQIEEYRDTLGRIEKGGAEECVRILAGEGKSLKETRERVRRIKEAVNDNGIAAIRKARLASMELWPELKGRGSDGTVAAEAERLAGLLTSPSFYEALAEIAKSASIISNAYRQFYRRLHDRRAKSYGAAIEDIKGRPEWITAPDELKGALLVPLLKRACAELETNEASATCEKCAATLSQMDSDLSALDALKSQAIVRLKESLIPKEKRVERVRLAEFFARDLDSEEAIEETLDRLRDHLVKLLAEGATIILE